ncbi:MAG TPA: DUF542 domain-containing protein, partial [Thermoanaerobaculia bacterium]|nr:DUF542 domain-containing protein [Thermoanaerobaculia bacterium]
MDSASVIDPVVPVKDLLGKYPHLSSALAAHGLDTCCGGMHPLEDACAAKGLALSEVVADLESAHAAAEAHSIVPPTTSIREVLRRFPATRPVLERWGLTDCGGVEGPDEPLAWFATVHRLPLDEFLQDVRAAAVRDSAAAPLAAGERRAGVRAERSEGRAPGDTSVPAPPLFSPHFLVGSLLLTLTLGATTGMINLIRIAAGGEVPIDHRQIHGHTQVLGFAALFLMGIAYHALPRILGVGGVRPGRAARASFWTMLTGVLLRNAGQPFGLHPAGRLLSLLSGILELAAGLLFARYVFDVLRQAPPGKYAKRDPMHVFVAGGTAWFVLALLLAAAQGVWLAGHVDTVLPAALNEPFYFAALYGFLLSWIYGFGHRVVSMFLGVGAPVGGTAEAAFVAQMIGVACAAASWVPGIPDAAGLALRDAGWALVAISALLFLGGNGFLWRRSNLPMLRTPGSPTVAIRMAFGWLAVWAVLELGAVVVARTTEFPARNLWWADAARHAFTIGFVTLLIVGMSFRILPVFSGKKLWSAKMAWATYGLLTLGAAL